MRARFLLPTIALVAGCGQRSPDAAPAKGVSPDSAAVTVAALAPRLRAGVLLRAIRDAGQDCQQVVTVDRADTASGSPAWVATCDGRHRWVVTVADDGTATVIDANLIAGRH